MTSKRLAFEENFNSMLMYYQKHQSEIDRVLSARFPDATQNNCSLTYDDKKDLLSFVTELPLLSPSLNNESELEPTDGYNWKPRFAASLKPLVDQQRINGYFLGSDVESPNMGAVRFERNHIIDIYKALSQPLLHSQKHADGFKSLCFAYIGFKEKIDFQGTTTPTEKIAPQEIEQQIFAPSFDQVFKVPTLDSLISEDSEKKADFHELVCDLLVIPFDKVSTDTYIDLSLNPRIKRSVDKFQDLIPFTNESSYPFQTPAFGVRTDNGISIIDGGTRRQFCVMNQAPLHVFVPREKNISTSILIWMQNQLFDSTTPLTRIEKYFQTQSLYENWCRDKKAKGEEAPVRGFSREFRESEAKLRRIFKFCHVVDKEILDYIDPKVISESGMIKTVQSLFAFKEDKDLSDDDKKQLTKGIFSNIYERKRQTIARFEKKNPDSELDSASIPIDWIKIIPSMIRKFDSEIIKLKNDSDISNAEDKEKYKHFLTHPSKRRNVLKSSNKNKIHTLTIKGMNQEQIVEIECRILEMLKENDPSGFELNADLHELRPELFNKLTQ